MEEVQAEELVFGVVFVVQAWVQSSLLQSYLLVMGAVLPLEMVRVSILVNVQAHSSSPSRVLLVEVVAFHHRCQVLECPFLRPMVVLA